MPHHDLAGEVADVRKVERGEDVRGVCHKHLRRPLIEQWTAQRVHAFTVFSCLSEPARARCCFLKKESLLKINLCKRSKKQ